jgi:GT2 family glycosyltransferase
MTEFVKFLAISKWTYSRLPRFFPCHDPETSGEVKKLFGACLLVRRSVLDQVGSFDERFFMYCEDVDLCHRIAQAGWRLFYLGDVEILHLGGSASANASSAFAVLMTCDSFSKFMRKYYGKSGSVTYRLIAFLGAQARLVMLLVMGIVGLTGLLGSKVDIRASMNKYFTIIKWALCLQRPVIRN